MRVMNDQHHLVADEVAVTADVIEVDEIDPETEEDPEATIVEEVDRVADQIGKIFRDPYIGIPRRDINGDHDRDHNNYFQKKP